MRAGCNEAYKVEAAKIKGERKKKNLIAGNGEYVETVRLSSRLNKHFTRASRMLYDREANSCRAG